MDGKRPVGTLTSLRLALAHALHNRAENLFGRLVVFGGVGLSTMIGYFLMYALLSLTLPSQLANLLTLIAMTLANTALNRRLTFQKRGRERAHIHYAAGILAFFISLGVSSFGIWLLHGAAPNISHLGETVWVTAFSLTATLVKYAVFSFGFREPKPKRPAPVKVDAN